MTVRMERKEWSHLRGVKVGGGYFIKGPTKNKESVLSIVWQDVCVCVCVCVCVV